MNLNEFVTETEGKLTGTNSANYGECVGLVQDWFQKESEPFFYGNAKDLYADAPSDSYTKGTSWPAPRGAAGVMDGSWGGGAGHTWISLGDGEVFEQNNPTGHAPKVSNYGQSAPAGYVGWILPNNYQGDDEVHKPNETDVRNFFARALAGEPTQDQINAYVNESIEVLYNDLLNYDITMINDLKKQVSSQSQTIDQLNAQIKSETVTPPMPDTNVTIPPITQLSQPSQKDITTITGFLINLWNKIKGTKNG